MATSTNTLAQTGQAVDAGDRLSFTVFIALALHALVILGVSFSLPKPGVGSQTMEITLATYKAEKAPDHADFIAQQNQEASGTEDQARQLTTERNAEFADAQVRDVSPIPKEAATAPNEKKDSQVITTTGNTKFTTQLQQNPVVMEEKIQRDGLLEEESTITTEIASLQAKLDKQRQEYAKRPRIRTLTSVSAKESFDAQYLNEWSEKIETIGNRNYPQEALRKHITGRLRLSVVINPDGSIYQIDILQSSGQKILDDSARKIVRLSAPFAKFPPEIRLQSDRLQIIRTWKFEMTGISTSSQ
jgi:periplasmic protein TonB